MDGKIPASNKLEFVNNYSASSVTQNALSVKKVLNGRDWNDSDTFTVQLAAKDGVPMPNGAKSQVSTVEITEKAPTEKIGDITYKTATFGDITYTKPGTYTYTISEVIPRFRCRGGRHKLFCRLLYRDGRGGGQPCRRSGRCEREGGAGV